MGKLDELMRSRGGNAAESLGGGARGTRVPAAAGAGAEQPGLSIPARLQGVVKLKGAVEIPVEKIHRDPNQPREEFDEAALGRLAESLRTRGQLQPIRVRWEDGTGAGDGEGQGQGRYLIVCGERRWRAAKMAGLMTLSAVVMEGEIDLLAVQLVENCLREDLRPIEQARAFRALKEAHGWSTRRLAEELALDHSGVAKQLLLLELPPVVQAEVDQGHLSPTTAYELTKVPDPEIQVELGRRAVAEKLTGAAVKDQIRARGKNPRPRLATAEYRARNGAVVLVSYPEGQAAAEAFIAEALGQVLRDLRKRGATTAA
jgi:ParB family chromosome partitioning protein